MPSLPADPSRRISEDDRDAAVRRLQDAYAEGHISHEEMDERHHQPRIRIYGTEHRSGQGGTLR